jgi:hypothetical protein
LAVTIMANNNTASLQCCCYRSFLWPTLAPLPTPQDVRYSMEPSKLRLHMMLYWNGNLLHGRGVWNHPLPMTIAGSNCPPRLLYGHTQYWDRTRPCTTRSTHWWWKAICYQSNRPNCSKKSGCEKKSDSTKKLQLDDIEVHVVCMLGFRFNFRPPII